MTDCEWHHVVQTAQLTHLLFGLPSSGRLVRFLLFLLLSLLLLLLLLFRRLEGKGKRTEGGTRHSFVRVGYKEKNIEGHTHHLVSEHVVEARRSRFGARDFILLT